MKTSYFKVLVLIIIAILLTANTSFALFGNTVGKAARETIEYTAKKFGIELSKDAGREFAEKSAQFIAKHGDDGARLLRHAGPGIMEVAAKHGDDVVRMCASHSDDAISFLMKNADEALPLWRQFGKEGTEIMFKHPGLGEQAIKEFGREGLSVANRLSSESLNKLLVLSSKTATQTEKQALFDAVLQRGDDVIESLWKHKWKIGAGAGVYALLKDPVIIIDPPLDGKPGIKTTIRNLPQKLAEDLWEKALSLPMKAWDKMLEKYPWITLAGFGLLIIWIWPALRFLWSVPGKLKNMFSRKETVQSAHD